MSMRMSMGPYASYASYEVSAQNYVALLFDHKYKANSSTETGARTDAYSSHSNTLTESLDTAMFTLST